MRSALLVMGLSLVAAGVLAALTPASPDDGIDHGGNPCSPALFEAVGLGSEDHLTDARPAEPARSDLDGTIELCQDAARRRLSGAAGLVVLGVSTLIVRRRVSASVTSPGSPQVTPELPHAIERRAE